MPQFTAADGTRLFYSDTGTGLPVLCLAGLTRNHTDFDHVAPHLAMHRLIRMDYRGRGRSDWADPATYSVPQEAEDAIALLDHLEIEQAALLGTSRGGLIAMFLAATAKERLRGVALNDVGPVLEQRGLSIIKDYVGRNPAQKSYQEAARFRARNWVHFKNVPMQRWLEEVEQHYKQTNAGLEIRYDPALREPVLASFDASPPDIWPLFEAMAGLPLALIRGKNSDLLSEKTANEMIRRRPDMFFANVPDRGHVPFLDEPEALHTLNRWLEAML